MDLILLTSLFAICFAAVFWPSLFLLPTGVVAGTRRVLSWAFALAIVWTVSLAHAWAQDTIVEFSYQGYLDMLVEFAVVAIVTFGAYLLKRWTGIQLTRERRDSLQAALGNAAKKMVTKQLPDGTIKIDVKNPALADGIQYVLDAAPDAVEYFGLDAESLKEKLLAKLPDITASQPAELMAGVVEETAKKPTTRRVK